MRLVFLYYCHGNAGPNDNVKWDRNASTSNRFALGLPEEGLFFLFKRLLDEKIIDECLAVIESTSSPGRIDYGSNFSGMVIPDINELVLKEGDIVFTRGGFRSWHDYLVAAQARGFWTWLYAANTGRQRWPWWDIVLDDITPELRHDKLGRVFLPYLKPINTQIFYYIRFAESIYDLMVGASYIHDKKGQHHVIEALLHYRNKYGRDLKCVMPGALRHGVGTSRLLDTIKRNNLNIDLPGMISRQKLSELMNRSKIFIHAGASGQNDRGPLEAMYCGCQTMIASPSHHSPTVWDNPQVSRVIQNSQDPGLLAEQINDFLNQWNPEKRRQAHDHFQEVNGLESVIIPNFVRLFAFFRRHPIRDRDALCREFGL